MIYLKTLCSTIIKRLVEKFRADAKGKEKLVTMDDYIYVGVYAEAEAGHQRGKELYYQLHKFSEKQATITILLEEKPAIAGIDPNYLLIDRMRKDNMIEMN